MGHHAFGGYIGFFQAPAFFYLFLFLVRPQICTMNLFYIQSIRYILLKFSYIAKHLQRMSTKKRLDNAKLRSLIFDFNRVQFELAEINDFWKELTGWNILYSLSFNIFLAFVGLHVEMRLKLIMFSVIANLYMTCICGISVFAGRVPAEVSTTLVLLELLGLIQSMVSFQIFKINHLLEKLSFRRTVSLPTKLKIESISSLGAPVYLSCFTW